MPLLVTFGTEVMRCKFLDLSGGRHSVADQDSGGEEAGGNRLPVGKAPLQRNPNR